MIIRGGTGSWTPKVSRRSKSSDVGAALSSSRRFPNPKSAKDRPISSKLFSMKAKDFLHRNSNTISPRSSIGFAKKLTNGEVYRLQLKSLLKLRGYCSTGAITSLTILGHSLSDRGRRDRYLAY